MVMCKNSYEKDKNRHKRMMNTARKVVQKAMGGEVEEGFIVMKISSNGMLN